MLLNEPEAVASRVRFNFFIVSRPLTNDSIAILRLASASSLVGNLRLCLNLCPDEESVPMSNWYIQPLPDLKTLPFKKSPLT